MSATYEYEKYVATKENLKEILNNYGVAIIPQVINEEETKEMVSGMWDFLEHITQGWKAPDKPISRNDESTWRGILGRRTRSAARCARRISRW